MSLYVLDTDVRTFYFRGDPTIVRNVDARPPADIAITVITVDEQLTGWYTLTRRVHEPGAVAKAYASLADSVAWLATF